MSIRPVLSRFAPRSGIGIRAIAILGPALLLAPSGARAQTVCITPNCTQGTPPVQCQNRAAPRTMTVVMTISGLTPLFNPATPKIEPGDCIQWQSAVVIHSSSADPCPDDTTTSCASPSPPSCLWDSGDVSSSGTPPAAICYYDPAVYPATTADGFYCRIHDNPQHTGTMHGTMNVTTAIQLSVNKNTSTGAVVLSWTGGGIAGDITYKVVRSNNGDPTFAVANTTTFNPDGGTTGTQFTDAGELSNPANRYYLVRNKQTNE